MKSEPESISTELQRNAKFSFWIFCIINVVALIFYFVGHRQFTIIALVAQLFIIIFMIFPVFIYHVLFKKRRLKLSLYKALASYKTFMEGVNWS